MTVTVTLPVLDELLGALPLPISALVFVALFVTNAEAIVELFESVVTLPAAGCVEFWANVSDASVELADIVVTMLVLVCVAFCESTVGPTVELVDSVVMFPIVVCVKFCDAKIVDVARLVELLIVTFAEVVTERLELVAEVMVPVSIEPAGVLLWLMVPESVRFAEETNWLGESKLRLLPVTDPCSMSSFCDELALVLAKIATSPNVFTLPWPLTIAYVEVPIVSVPVAFCIISQ